jgi:hypothetical protein
MCQVHFRCSNAQGNVLDHRIVDVGGFIEARQYATNIARSLIATPNLRDWRSCLLSADDDLGEQLFVMSFSSIIGRLH